MTAAPETTDVLICGAGLAGLIAACAFAHHGYRVTIIDPRPEPDNDDDPADLRSTAFLHPARDLFAEIGLWPALAKEAVPLNGLRLVDTTGEPPEVRDQRLFEWDGDAPLGWNFRNAALARILLRELAENPSVTVCFKTTFEGTVTRLNEARVTLSGGQTMRARLVIGADGRNSAVREAAGIGIKTQHYGQKALTFTATHKSAHDNVSTEIYHKGGPFTCVPVADVDGRPASAIVWMNPGARATNLASMPEAAFNAEMNARSAGLFGDMALSGKRAVWPVINQVAQALTAQRTALIAEAAHVLPPIGAQGLNTSVNDIAALVHAIARHGDDPGAPAALDAYQQARLKDIRIRSRAIDVFNRVTRSENPLAQAVRLAGLRAVHDVNPVRRAVMRAGMAPP